MAFTMGLGEGMISPVRGSTLSQGAASRSRATMSRLEKMQSPIQIVRTMAAALVDLFRATSAGRI